MSEVLSGSDARSGRFTISPTDERQSLRLGRFLMAAGRLVPPDDGQHRRRDLRPGRDVQAVLARADKALYQAKAAGRNQVSALG
jgi:GGDEF domain-containing protein